MKKIDLMVIRAFLGPFILTTAIVVFIFLMRYLMMYFNDFVGKDLGIDVFLKLFGYFSIIAVPMALPLSTLLAALMTYGNLGEHFELTALKSVGISVFRVIMPLLALILTISFFTFWYNNKVTPWANLKAYSLLYDIRTAKLTLNITEGIFYREIPGYSIKVSKKYPDGKSLKNIIVYNHAENNGNKNVTLADSGRMYTTNGGNNLVFELFNGSNYTEYASNSGNYDDTQYLKNFFKKNKFVVSLESFGMKRTAEDQFKYHPWMKDIPQLKASIDSTKKDIEFSINTQSRQAITSHVYLFRPPIVDSLKTQQKVIKAGPWVKEKFYKGEDSYRMEEIYGSTISSLQNAKSRFESNLELIKTKSRDMNKNDIERWHKYTMAVNVIVMFIIGASLGSIIKKGGFGLPVLLGIILYIFLFVLMQTGDKNAIEGLISVPAGAWTSNIVLGILAIYLLIKANNDARLFDLDAYAVYFDRIKNHLKKKKLIFK